jgi:DNA sulfur modification protein DndB
MTSYVFPAIRGLMGSTAFFQVTMTAKELAGIAGPASELAEWKQWTIGERFQRDLAIHRVRQELVPYLVQSNDRFFGSLIVLIYQPDWFRFEPLDLAAAPQQAAYRRAAGRMGFLAVSGGQYVALDGQHRLVALREIVNGSANADPAASADVAADEVSVVFIRYESLEKTRRIFNKVNRHARPTSPADNIITSEDDGYAIVARWLVEQEPPLGLSAPAPPLALFDAVGGPLVEWRKTGLDQFTTKLTTLQAVYQTVEVVCDAHGLRHFDEKHRVNRPSDLELARAYTWTAEAWSAALTGLEAYRRAVAWPARIRDMRQYQENWSLLFRPVAQVALFRSLGQLTQAGLTLAEATTAVNRIDWCAASYTWTDILVRSNGRMITAPNLIWLAGTVIAYLAMPSSLTPQQTDRMKRDYAEAKGEDPSQVTWPHDAISKTGAS